jgi:hypothetical protein
MIINTRTESLKGSNTTYFNQLKVGAMCGYMGGSVTGLANMIRKFGAGLVHAGTFWKPEYIYGRVEPAANTYVPVPVDCLSYPDSF